MLRTKKSHESIEEGKFMVPIRGSICQNLSGFPISTIINEIHIITEQTASNSPKITISLIGFQS